MADIKLDSFKAQLKSGVRPNRFWVTIFGKQGGATWQEQPFSFLVKSFPIPDRTIGEVSVPFMGQTTKLAGDMTVSDVTMVVHIDKDMAIKEYFETWMEGIAQMYGTENVRSDPEEYKAEIHVEQLDNSGSPIKTYKLNGAWPKQMNSIELSHDSQDTLEDLSVDFAIDTWELI